jgi:translation elongation factor EF-G
VPTHSQKSPNSPDPALDLRIFGHDPLLCQQVATTFHGSTDIAYSAECDLAIFVIDPAQGIDAATITQWESLDESMVPRLVAVVGLENSQADFDDAVLLANRVFAPTVTPYLVLHDDAGVACALIRLEDMKILNYKTFPPTVEESESEHQTLVTEFRTEYLEATEVMGEDAFTAGLLFPAIPLWIEKQIGVDIIKDFVEKVAAARI